MKNGLAEDILGEEGRSRKLRLRVRERRKLLLRERRNEYFAYEEEGMNTALISKRTQETALTRKKK